ncbi:MAG: M14 family metallopeptidase [Pseudomonadota bacterium]
MLRKTILFLLTACSLSFASCVSAETERISFSADMARGERTDFRVEIDAGDNDPATFIPVSVIKGASPGPTVVMVAGVHGYEFAPLLAAERLADEIDPSDLSGTLMIVRVAHISSFENRSPYVNPHDRKNLNRSFPGDPEGSQTDRIAWALSSKIISEADFVLDVHSGDGAEWLEAFVGVYGGPLATDYRTAFQFAEAMGFPNIVRYQMKTQLQIDTGRSLNRQAVAEGVPTILVEIGQNGSRDPDHVGAIIFGVKRGLQSLDMYDYDGGVTETPLRYFEGTRSVPVQNSGIWTPKSAFGRFVESGDELGVIRDYEGKHVETVLAPSSGYTLYGLAGPPVREGESIATIANPSTRAELSPDIVDGQAEQ